LCILACPRIGLSSTAVLLRPKCRPKDTVRWECCRAVPTRLGDRKSSRRNVLPNQQAYGSKQLSVPLQLVSVRR
jgi:hypothetical protein